MCEVAGTDIIQVSYFDHSNNIQMDYQQEYLVATLENFMFKVN